MSWATSATGARSRSSGAAATSGSSSLPLSPGMHQINVRVDGGPWIAPPGVPTMRDGFNGEVGLVVITREKGSH